MTTPPPTRLQWQHERESSKKRIVHAFREGRNWRDVTAINGVAYQTARRAILQDGSERKQQGGVRALRVKTTVDVKTKL